MALEWPGSISLGAMAAASLLQAASNGAGSYGWQLLRMHYKVYTRRRKNITAK